MNIRDYASQFTVSVFSQDVDLGTKLKYAITQAGYDNHYFTDIDEQISSADENPPHIIVFDARGALLPPHEYVATCLKISTEIKFIFLSLPEQIHAFKSYRKYNVYHFLNVLDIAIEHTTLASVESLAEIIYRTYQNEQLAESLNEVEGKAIKLQQTLEQERSAPKVRPYQNRIADYKSALSKEQLLDIFYKQTPQQSWIYLKYVATIQTFVCVSYSQVPEQWVEGISFKVPNHEKGFVEKMLIGELPFSLESYLKGKFETLHLKFLPLIVKDRLEGVLISTQDISSEVAEDFSLMSLVYAVFVFESEPKHLDIEDSFTGLYNHVFYNRILDRELDRSKRSFVPISIVKISIDKFSELEVSQGKAVVDDLILRVTEVIKMTSRLPDYLCRTAENEFTLILTNCNRKGAAIRAERLRQALSKENIIVNGVRITVSQGISEYPTLTYDALDLDNSALRALKFITSKGGDKICIYKPPADHRPDFVVES